MGLSVASIGECMLELSGSGGDSWHMGFAGDTFNTLWTMRALLPAPAATDYVSAFGDDPFSVGQRGFMAEHGIGTAKSPVIPGARPGLYAITLSGAERSFTYWRSDAAARQLASDPAALAGSLAGRALAYFSGITLAILEPDARKFLFDALKKARAAGTLIAFDPNYRPRLWESDSAARETFSEALALTDIALPTFPDEQALYGDASMEATAKRMAEAGVGEIVVKDGAEPALLFGKGSGRMLPAVPTKAIDTTAAGDSFNGSYLAARLLGDEPATAVTRAHRVASAVVQVRGALAPFEVLQTAFAD
ncbi:MAG: sugar kinase [Hyphomicrobiales bacterium]|nr:sugar kinase [Hyphomicrobiales bacterium]